MLHWGRRQGRTVFCPRGPALGTYRGGRGGGYDDLPLGRGSGGTAYGGFYDGMDRFGGAVRGV